MKRLFLLRHAKARRDDSHGDEARALMGRGREDAAHLGQFMREANYYPDLVLCSTAVRTRETLDLILPNFRARPAVQYRGELYLADTQTICSFVHHASDAADALMIVGHNPGMWECAHALTRPPKDAKMQKRYDAMADRFPTCALAAFDFDVAGWGEVGPHAGEFTLFVRPKDFE